MIRTLIKKSAQQFCSKVPPVRKMWNPQASAPKSEFKDRSQDTKDKSQDGYQDSYREKDFNQDKQKQSNQESRSFNRRPPVQETRGPQNVQSLQFQPKVDEEQKAKLSKQPKKKQYTSLREATEDSQPQILVNLKPLKKSAEEEKKISEKQKILLDEYNQQRSQKTKNYSSLIKLSGELQIDFTGHFQEYLDQNSGFDKQVYSEYTKAVINSKENYDTQFKRFKKIIPTNIKNLDSKDIVLYYELIFKTNLLTQQKGQELVDLLSRIKRQDLKILNLDLSHFNNIFNLETYSSQRDFLFPVRAIQQYIEYNLDNNQNAKSLPNLDMIFLICRQYTQKEGLQNHSDTCLEILKNLSKYNAVDMIPIQEIALWTKSYLKLNKGLKTILPILNEISNSQFIRYFDESVRQIEEEGFELDCLKTLREDYQTLKAPSSTTLEVFCTLAERKNDWKLIVDIFQTYSSRIKSKPQRSQHIYKKVIEAVLAQSTSKNNINAVQQLIQEAQQEKSLIPQFNQELFTIKALIRDGHYPSALSNFSKNLIEGQIVSYQKDKIRKMLYSYIQESFGVTTKFDYNPQYLNARTRIDSLINQLQPQQLKKMHQEELSDNTLLEALTFSEDPFAFWEDMQRMNAFYYLRNSILANIVNVQELVNVDPNNKQLLYKREALDDYEKYLGLEKKHRINERRSSRIMQVIDSLKLVQLIEKTEEQLMEDFEKHIGQEFLNKKIFGKAEDEFPELEKVLELREAIKHIESQLQTPLKREESKDAEVLFDLGQELRAFEKRIETLEVENQELVLHETEQIIPEPYKQNSEGEYRDDFPQLPVLDSAAVIKEFIQEHYDPSVNQYYLGSIQQNPMKPKDRPYGAKFMTMQNIEEMKWRYYHLYNSGFEYINGQPMEQSLQNQIWDLMAWGVHNNEPMAIKLGEYYSQHVGVTIPKHISKLVAHYYKFDLRQEEANKRFKAAHEAIGPILYEKVYDETDTVYSKVMDKEILQKMETTFEFKGLARSLLKTTYSNQKYQRYGVTMKDVLQSIKASL